MSSENRFLGVSYMITDPGDPSEYQMDFYSHEVSGSDVCSDREMLHRLTKLHELEEGHVVYASGPLGDLRRITVTQVTGRFWYGQDGGLIVSGSFQPKRYLHLSDDPEYDQGGWACECFGDASRLAMAEF